MMTKRTIKKINFSFVILILILLGVGCGKDNCEPSPEIRIDTIYITDTTYIYDTVYIMDPATAILGKWEETAYGNLPDEMYTVENPTAYTEYLLDSIVNYYSYNTGFLYQAKYWIEDEFLYIGSGENEAMFEIEYIFLNNNSLRLIQWSLDPFKVKEYKRLE